MKIRCVRLLACLVLFSCTRDWDNPYDSKGAVAPTPPTGLRIVVLNDTTIDLMWQHSRGEIGYRIERQTDGGPFEEIGTVSQDITDFEDTRVQPNHRYGYRVTAFAANGREAYPDAIRYDLPGGATMEMVWMPPGTFVMGSPSSEWYRDSDEGPQHEVTISQGFYLGKYEITQAQWESVMSTRPWAAEDYVRENPSHPAVYISWNDVQALIAKLNEVQGSEVYRLPTEAEWEYACRAGTTTFWSFGDDEGQLKDYAWYEVNAWNAGEQYAHEAGTKLPNPWGLYDMYGNVEEWVQDRYGLYSGGAQTDPMGPAIGSWRVIRGGGFHDYARDVRSADRYGPSPDFRYNGIGARLVRQDQ